MKQISQKQQTHLSKLREIRTTQTKELLQKAFRELIQAKETPTKYKLHKQTNIAYSTINKYYDELVNG